MFAAVTPIFILAAAAIYVRADPNPNNPGPGNVFIQGKPCLIGWDVDTTGVWKTMNIDLMTGDNFDMVFLTSVGTVDGTDASKNTFSFTCPQVTPHSPIYFYQFSSPATSNKTWTGRFTITDSPNDIVAPAQSTQPDGTKIPWGTGSLVSGSASSGSGASVMPSSTSVTLVASSSTPSITSGSPLLSTPSTASATATVVVVTSKVSATPSTASTPNGAATLSVSNFVFQAALALGFAAFGFTVIF